MAQTFKRKESVRKGVQRLTKRGANKALEHLAHCSRLEAIHEVRKEIKRLRALLRLVRDSMPAADYRRWSDVLRETAADLAGARDAQVKVNALRKLTEHFRRELSPRAFARIRRRLAAECRKQQAELSKESATRHVRRGLHKLAKKCGSFRFRQRGWSALSSGIWRSYRNGRRAFQLSCKAPRPEHFHCWRKRVKDLYYQLNLLCPIWPAQLAAAGELKRLGEYLGDDHDLFLLIEPALLKSFGKEAPEEAEILNALVNERQEQLRAQAMEIGARLYHEKPAFFCKRLEQYWKRWR